VKSFGKIGKVGAGETSATFDVLELVRKSKKKCGV
jgi:hypothetical protein